LHRTTVLEMMVAAPRLLSRHELAIFLWNDSPVPIATCRSSSSTIAGSISGSHRHRLGRFFGRFRRLKPEVCGRAWLMNYLSN
jgi:hypothetical protein